MPGSAVQRAITRCNQVQANPDEWLDAGYQGFRWIDALGACLIGYKVTGSAQHRAAALVYLNALLDDQQTLGDGLGPSYENGEGEVVGIVGQDSGFSMRTFGVFAALGYDWLYDDLTPAVRAKAATRFAQWIAFHMHPDTYNREAPGSNYHSGHLLAMSLLATGHAHEMDAAAAGSGTQLWNYVTGTMWGTVMASGRAPRGALTGGDWLEGWQYGPLATLSYALGERALAENGAPVAGWSKQQHEVLMRYVFGLTPDDRVFVGGDNEDPAPYLEPNPWPLYGVAAGSARTRDRANALAELDRLSPPDSIEFAIIYQALQQAVTLAPRRIDRDALPAGWLAEGAGNFYVRTGFDANDAWGVSQCRGQMFDHQHPNAGNVVLSRGGDHLLVDPGPYGTRSTLTSNAPTMSQPHFASDYQPSQGGWGEFNPPEIVPLAQSTRFRFARATVSGVAATRCDYLGQFRFQGNASEIASRAWRDVVLLPGARGASMLVLDSVRTTAAYAATPNPLLLRFHSPGTFTASARQASAAVGGSTLTIRRLDGSATARVAAVPEGTCFDADVLTHGSCHKGRYPTTEWSIEVAGPNPRAIHLLDASATGAALPAASVQRQGPVQLVSVTREGQRFLVVAHVAGGKITAYSAPAVAGRHVVLDPPAGVSVAVSAALVGGNCSFALAPSAGALQSRPLVMNVDAGCNVSEDAAAPAP